MINEDYISTIEIKQKAIKSVKWTVFTEIASLSAVPIITLILAHFLTPADFGIIGIATIVINLVRTLQDFGFGKTLIQREKDIDESANTAFWSNLILSLFFYLVIFITAPLFSKFFYEPEVINVLRVLCLQIILFSFSTIHQALLQRNFKFKHLFFIRLFSALVTVFTSIPLAMFGYGVWALVFGALAGNIVQFLLFWRTSLFHPKLSYDFQIAKQLYGFGGWATLEALLLWLIICGDSIIVGRFLGVKVLGIYRTGVIFVTFIFGIFFNPLIFVAYSAFSRLQTKSKELKGLFLKIVHLIAVIFLPIGAGLFILARPISSVIFGEKWQGINLVIALIGVEEAIALLTGVNAEAYRAIGRPDITSKLLIAAIIYYIPVYIFAAPHGLLIFCLARLILIIISTGLEIFVANRMLDLSFTYFGNSIKYPLMGSLIMAIILFFILNFTGTFIGFEGWLKILGAIAIGGITYALALWLIEKELIRQFFRLIKVGI